MTPIATGIDTGRRYNLWLSFAITFVLLCVEYERKVNYKKHTLCKNRIKSTIFGRETSTKVPEVFMCPVGNRSLQVRVSTHVCNIW